MKQKINYTMLEKPYLIKSFSVQDQNGKDFSQKDILGNWCVLYFYPKDMTSGCTIEAKDFEENLSKFKKLGVKIIGVSKDSCNSHKKFIEKEGLSFTLLSDTEQILINIFDVMKEKSMYGKKYLGIERSTFLIDPKGKCVCEWRKVKVTDHVNEVYCVLSDLMK